MQITVGKSFPVAAILVAENVTLCEIALRFDDAVLQEITGNSNPSAFVGPNMEKQVAWELRAKRAIAETIVRLDAHGNGLPQLSEFAVEVLQ